MCPELLSRNSQGLCASLSDSFTNINDLMWSGTFCMILQCSHLYFPASYPARLGCRSHRNYSEQRSHSIVFSEEESQVLGSEGRNANTGRAWRLGWRARFQQSAPSKRHAPTWPSAQTYLPFSSYLLVVRWMDNQPPHTRLLCIPGWAPNHAENCNFINDTSFYNGLVSTDPRKAHQSQDTRSWSKHLHVQAPLPPHIRNLDSMISLQQSQLNTNHTLQRKLFVRDVAGSV